MCHMVRVIALAVELTVTLFVRPVLGQTQLVIDSELELACLQSLIRISFVHRHLELHVSLVMYPCVVAESIIY